MKHTKNYKKGYLRPQFTRNYFRILNGEWNFTFDNENKGEELKYFNSFMPHYKIIVPYAYQCKASNINILDYCENVWYNQSFDFSKDITDNKRAILYFEGADYHTKVWINGIYVGENYGGYVRFSFDITDYLKNARQIFQ